MGDAWRVGLTEDMGVICENMRNCGRSYAALAGPVRNLLGSVFTGGTRGKVPKFVGVFSKVNE